jgi:hypothetical protein
MPPELPLVPLFVGPPSSSNSSLAADPAICHILIANFRITATIATARGGFPRTPKHSPAEAAPSLTARHPPHLFKAAGDLQLILDPDFH